MAFLWPLDWLAVRRANGRRLHVLTRTGAERRAAFRVVMLQGLIAVTMACAIAVIWGVPAGGSALLGGCVGAAATLVFVIALFRLPEGAAQGRVVVSFFVGQGLKVALTVALLAVAFRSRRVVPLALLGGYAATYAAYWLARRTPAVRS